MEEALACPLRDVGTVDISWQWTTAEVMSQRLRLRAIMPVRLRLVKRFGQLVGPSDAHLVVYSRVMLVDHGKEVPLPDLLQFYQQARQVQRNPGDLTTGCDSASLTGKVAHRVANEGVRTNDRQLYLQGCQLLQQAAAEAEAVGEAYPQLVLRLGELGHMLMAEGDMADAKQAFERAVAAAQRVWGEELLGKGMDIGNHFWLSAYVEMLEKDKDKDEATAVRWKWLAAVQAELDGRDEQLSEATLAEIRAAMRRERGVAPVADDDEAGGGGSGVGMSRRAQLRLAARQRAAKARQLKRAKALTRREEVVRAAADPPVGAPVATAGAAVDEKEEEQEEEEGMNECAICLVELAPDEREVLPDCAHAFHWKCIETWHEKCRTQQRPNTCPYCRAAI